MLEYNSYSKAADVYSLGAILWEILHSRPCYRRTVVGFPVRHPDFPKFSDSAPLPYAALTAACLHSNPSLRYAHALSRRATRRSPNAGPPRPQQRRGRAARADASLRCRPTMDEVVAVLQDLFTVPGEDSAHLAQAADAKAAADADGATHVTPLVRRVLGSDAEVFRRAPHWRGAALSPVRI